MLFRSITSRTGRSWCPSRGVVQRTWEMLLKALPQQPWGPVPSVPRVLLLQCLWLTRPPSQVSFARIPEPACWLGGTSSRWQVPSPASGYTPGLRASGTGPASASSWWERPLVLPSWRMGQPGWGSGPWGATCLKERGIRDRPGCKVEHTDVALPSLWVVPLAHPRPHG